MKKWMNPPRSQWEALCARPVLETAQLDTIVREIVEEVKRCGDAALFDYAKQFDGVEMDTLMLGPEDFKLAREALSSELKEAIALAQQNIEIFHARQQESPQRIETSPGVLCWRESKAIEKVGLYIPGGTAPLFSTVLMLGVPAKLAGCSEIVLCTPPRKDGSIDPAIVYTAERVGITRIFKVGGAQAIAAMANGTESIPQVYKIFGPGNQYVTKAKECVQQSGTAIDLPAGPSEVLVIADETCEPDFVAADLLSQAEHGVDSQVILLSPSENVIDAVLAALAQQLELLPRKEIAAKALVKSSAVCLESMEECLAFSNAYAPEHLIVASQRAESYLDLVCNAGSVFVGNYSCESAGDYASGTNHTLPTNGYARSYSGVSLDSFVRKITFQQLSAEGLQNIGPAIECMATAEDLFAHKNAVTLRLKSLNDA